VSHSGWSTKTASLALAAENVGLQVELSAWTHRAMEVEVKCEELHQVKSLQLYDQFEAKVEERSNSTYKERNSPGIVRLYRQPSMLALLRLKNWGTEPCSEWFKA
jgi:hypothetical protein